MRSDVQANFPLPVKAGRGNRSVRYSPNRIQTKLKAIPIDYRGVQTHLKAGDLRAVRRPITQRTCMSSLNAQSMPTSTKALPECPESSAAGAL